MNADTALMAVQQFSGLLDDRFPVAVQHFGRPEVLKFQIPRFVQHQFAMGFQRVDCQCGTKNWEIGHETPLKETKRLSPD